MGSSISRFIDKPARKKRFTDKVDSQVNGFIGKWPEEKTGVKILAQKY